MQKELPSKLKDYVEEKVRSGAYASEEDVVVAGLESLQAAELQFAELKRDIEIGIAAADNGQFSDKTVRQIVEQALKGDAA